MLLVSRSLPAIYRAVHIELLTSGNRFRHTVQNSSLASAILWLHISSLARCDQPPHNPSLPHGPLAPSCHPFWHVMCAFA